MADMPTVIVIVIMVGICALVKRHSDCEWQKFEEERRKEHLKNVARAAKKFAEDMKNAK
ncbi:MAG: hypothetical protein E7L09_05765 [Enterobacteriaceae bacterium]|nr:hypothetical protein [Enterobacteriaceae bacterium]